MVAETNTPLVTRDIINEDRWTMEGHLIHWSITL
jgi:hypothetical protein